MIGAAKQEAGVASAAKLPLRVAASGFASSPAIVYRALTGGLPADALIDDDHAFDRHVLASILSAAMAEPGPINARCGLGADDFVALVTSFFPHISVLLSVLASGEPDVDEEAAMVRDLLLAHRSTPGEVGRWLATMVARRAMEPDHLWEDLGLRDRTELTRLLMRHFGPLARDNTRNMRWKRFFYRKLCEDDGMVMCSAPVCSQCNDFAECFGDESGESRMAGRRREIEQRAAGVS
ncbi:nitrogen fixation protein NifQ [Rhodopseudomonas pseudopalustris]|uniref:Nitrogen fixation protein NifQ n=1 Tax=Rhodopseudomonas pseudopalustris TaxID=1513892 RepID=A0A1H8NG01_9BRAD|nr:nitrogen fixation protein NifQ [Rhodopseudomonas pseudopalustris]SEO28497.1 nitrogen fixation protein NifQ [Rhodopseudomonas pseudopalustris]